MARSKLHAKREGSTGGFTGMVDTYCGRRVHRDNTVSKWWAKDGGELICSRCHRQVVREHGPARQLALGQEVS